jgi:uncharacterized membrane protein
MPTLIVLLSSFLIILIIHRLVKKKWDIVPAGRIALSILLLFTASGHFIYTDGLSMTVPEFLPFKKAIIYLTGIFEIAAAIFFLIPKYRVVVSWLLIVFFILILPSNIIAALNYFDYQTATYTASGPDYLWFRIPLQILFIGWTYYFGIRRKE